MLHNNWPKIARGIRAYNRLRFARPSAAEKVVAIGYKARAPSENLEIYSLLFDGSKGGQVKAN